MDKMEESCPVCGHHLDLDGAEQCRLCFDYVHETCMGQLGQCKDCFLAPVKAIAPEDLYSLIQFASLLDFRSLEGDNPNDRYRRYFLDLLARLLHEYGDSL